MVNKKMLVALGGLILIGALIFLATKSGIPGFNNYARPIEKTTDIRLESNVKPEDCFRKAGPCGFIVETGEFFSCAVAESTVKCWGDNRSAQLGNGTVGGFVTTPKNVLGLSGRVIDVATGNLHACALLDTGSIQCWGANQEGQLGNGTTNPWSLTPVTVSGITNAAAITAGLAHTCATLTTGQMRCWGHNKYGQLGNGTTTNSSTPVAVLIPVGVTNISAGTINTCAISNNQAYCWGWNQYGQVGNGSTSLSVLNPNPIVSLSSVKSIATANGHSCAVLISGEVRCWGHNQYGQLGNGTTTDSSNPVSTGLMTGLQVTTGDGHSCVVVSGGKIKCWGWNKFGQLGNGLPPSSINPTPQDVLNITNAVQVSAKFSHTCAVAGTASFTTPVTVYCFGQGFNGALGNNTTANSNIPVVALSLAFTPEEVISGGDWHTCAITPTGAVECFGDGAQGQLGAGNFLGSSTSIPTVVLTSGATDVSAGEDATCAVQNGAVKCWGITNYNDTTMVLTTSNTPVNQVGLANGVTDVTVSGRSYSFQNANLVLIRLHFSCAIKNGGAFCWGNNGFGQLGNGTTSPLTTFVPTPVAVTGLGANVTSISAGATHACAVQSGTVKCWGRGYGAGSSTTPVVIAGLPAGGVKSVYAGKYYSCAILNTGGLRCWGENTQGQLGNGTNTLSWTPVQVIGLTSGIIDVSLSKGSDYSHTCALDCNGNVKCWGSNSNGQLGNNSAVSSNVPVNVLNQLGTGILNGVKAITNGYLYSCSMQSTNQSTCWGANAWGNLGNGNTIQSSIPVSVINFP